MAGTISATIFDVDGVLVNSPHERAWREALAGFADPAQFTTTFYQAYVAGKPRLEGARSALERLGAANAAAAAEKYAEAKQALIDRLIEQCSFEAFPDAVRLAAALHAAGLKLALASSSKNAEAMLRQIKLPDGRTRASAAVRLPARASARAAVPSPPTALRQSASSPPSSLPHPDWPRPGNWLV